jgi:hypothetical protein
VPLDIVEYLESYALFRPLRQKQKDIFIMGEREHSSPDISNSHFYT